MSETPQTTTPPKAFRVVLVDGKPLLVPTVFLEVASLRATKAQDYRNSKAATLADYFPFGLLSHAQMVWTKALRFMNLVSTQRTPNHEGIRDTLKDIINYACFAIEDLDGTLEGRDTEEAK